MLAAHSAVHGLQSIQVLIVAICVLVVVFWRIALVIVAMLLLLFIASGVVGLSEAMLHLIR
jgi:hypothetical protein